MASSVYLCIASCHPITGSKAPQPQPANVLRKRRLNTVTAMARMHNRPFQTAHVSAIATSLAVLFFSCPAQAGIFSGISGLETIPAPELPQIDFLTRIQEESRRRSEANDAKFKASPLLQELLKRSKENYARNKQEIEDKYCERGAEWGVGNCSTIGMTPAEREEFFKTLKSKKIAPN